MVLNNQHKEQKIKESKYILNLIKTNGVPK